MENRDKTMSKEELVNLKKKLSTPIDFEQLEKDGILVKEGAWYRIFDMNRLPEHARLKIQTLATDKKGSKVKFTSNK